MLLKLKNITFLLLTFALFSCTSKKEPKSELRLISWNCNNFLLSLDTLHTAAKFLNGLNPDIICLQERPHTNLVRYDSIKKCFPSLPYKVTNGREDENLNVSIFSKYPVSNVKTWYFTNTYNKMIQADIETDITKIRVFNVHLQTTSHGKNITYNCKQRYKQSKLLKQEIKKSPYPVLVCGDFNDIYLSYTIIDLLTDLNDFSLTWLGSYQKFKKVFKIDYILGTKNFIKQKYKLITNYWSDHKIQYTILQIHPEN